MVSPSPGVSEDDLGRLAAIQLQIVSLGTFLHIGELHTPGRLVAGRDDDVRVIGEFAGQVSWHSGGEVAGGDDIGGWSNG